MGAALATEKGAIFSGCNVENASYPVGTCAEQVAIGTMVAAGHRSIAALLVVGPGGAPIAPCGACRQRIGEFADASTLIYLAGPSGIEPFTLDALLPRAFGLQHVPSARGRGENPS